MILSTLLFLWNVNFKLLVWLFSVFTFLEDLLKRLLNLYLLTEFSLFILESKLTFVFSNSLNFWNFVILSSLKILLWKFSVLTFIIFLLKISLLKRLLELLSNVIFFDIFLVEVFLNGRLLLSLSLLLSLLYSLLLLLFLLL